MERMKGVGIDMERMRGIGSALERMIGVGCEMEQVRRVGTVHHEHTTLSPHRRCEHTLHSLALVH